MKKSILCALVLAVATLSVQAQGYPKGKHGKFKGHDHHAVLKDLKLSEEQKSKFKSLNEDFRNQLQELKKNEDITVKEWKTKMEALRKEHRTQMQALLTTEQKDQLKKRNEERLALHKVDQNARMEKMKVRLGLSDEQLEKIKQNRTEMVGQMKALHENKSLSQEEKRAQMKELMKKQKDGFKAILTKEQVKKLHEKQAHRPAKQPT